MQPTDRLNRRGLPLLRLPWNRVSAASSSRMKRRYRDNGRASCSDEGLMVRPYALIFMVKSASAMEIRGTSTIGFAASGSRSAEHFFHVCHASTHGTRVGTVQLVMFGYVQMQESAGLSVSRCQQRCRRSRAQRLLTSWPRRSVEVALRSTWGKNHPESIQIHP